jgi:hypothetical protein
MKTKIILLFFCWFSLTSAQWSSWQPFFNCQVFYVQYCYKIVWQENKGSIILRFKELSQFQYPIIEKYRVVAESNLGRQVTVKNGEQITLIKYFDTYHESDEYAIDFYEENGENKFIVGADQSYVARWGFPFLPPKYFERNLSYYSDIAFQCDYNPKYEIKIPPLGCIFIHSDPPAAFVYVDGIFQGRANITSFRIHPGNHTILYEKGDLIKTEELDILPGYNASHFISLEK